MRLQDQDAFRKWLQEQQDRDQEVHGAPAGEATTCGGCGVGADECEIIQGQCLTCLALDFGIYKAETRIARIAHGIASRLATGGIDGAYVLVQHTTDRMEEVLSDYDHDERAGS